MENNNSNNSTEDNNKNNKNKLNNKSKFIKDFCDNDIINSSEKNELLDSIFEKSKLPKNLIDINLKYHKDSKEYE
jgi:hypothetical protein